VNRLIQLQVTSVTLVFSLVSISTLAQPMAANTFSFTFAQRLPTQKCGLRPTAKAMPNQLAARNRDLTDISIGGIKIGMTLQQVTKKLGKPNRISRISDPCTGQNRITLRYNKLIITILGEIVLEIENSNPIYQTGEKIKIGDPLSKAKNVYDKILSTPSSSNQEGRELLYDKSADGILRFKSKQGKITSISIAINDC
jgi:hypothetical protein